MGMTIDDASIWLNTDDYESKGFAEATSVAIETMRKYQKIQEAMDNRADDDAESNSKALNKIEVIMYGDADQ